MQHNNKPFEPDDQDLPEGWDPSVEVDPQLETILRLSRECAAPAEEPRAAAMEGLRLATRRQLFAERLIHADDLKPRGEKSFAATLRKVLFGGGTSAQLLRLGATASLAFAVGTGFVVSNESNSPQENRTIDAAPTTQVAVATPSTIAAEKPVAADAVTKEDVSVATSSPTNPARALNGVSISRSTATDMENGWTSTASPSQRWVMLQGDPSSVAVSGRSLPQSVARGVDEVQLLKVNALATGDDASLSNLRNLDKTLSQLMSEYEENKQQSQLTALERVQQADKMYDAHRYRDAINEFERAQQLAPGTPLALISEIRIGQIAYEKLNDFELAQSSFQNAKEKYQGISITPEAQNYVNSRLDVLKGTAENNWAMLAAWRDSERAGTAREAVPSLLKIVDQCGYPELVSRAAMRLRDYALNPNTAMDVDYNQVEATLTARLKDGTPNQFTARTQFALADMTLGLAGDYQLAAERFQTAQRMSPDAETLRMIQARLMQIEARTGRVALPPSR